MGNVHVVLRQKFQILFNSIKHPIPIISQNNHYISFSKTFLRIHTHYNVINKYFYFSALLFVVHVFDVSGVVALRRSTTILLKKPFVHAVK